MVCSDADLAAVQLLVNSPTVARAVCASYNVTSLGSNVAVTRYTLNELAATRTELSRTQGVLAGTNRGLDASFVLASSYQVFVMQAGFALFCAGVVRSKNVFNILLKNIIDAAIASITFYLIGYGLAYGIGDNVNGFIGSADFALSDTGSSQYPAWQGFVWNWAFSAAAATIVSGAVAERATFFAYLCYSTVISTLVYPVAVHWIWAPNGWLSPRNLNPLLGIGAIDFAGDSVVHCVGGFASLVGAVIIGPRIGRFDPSLRFTVFGGSSNPSQFVLGTFLLWFGWYGFNPGSVLHISSDHYADQVGRVAVVTTLGAGSGAVAAALLSYWRTRTWHLLAICTGLLAGLVSITAGCSVVEPWVGILAGAVAAVIVAYGEDALHALHIDDPVAAAPLHAGCGLWGLLLVGLLGKNKFIREVYGDQVASDQAGIFYGGNGKLLACQLLLMLVVPLWVVANTSLLFFTLKRFGRLRVSTEEEVMGLDKVTGGEVNGGVGVNDAKVGGMLNVHLAMIGASFRSRDGRHSQEGKPEQDASGSDAGPADAA